MHGNTIQVMERSGRAGSIGGVQDGPDANSDELVFFRPVDGNLSHHTFLGQSFSSDFNFMSQLYHIVQVEVHPTTKSLVGVTLGSTAGPPTAMKLSPIPYEVLSSKLCAWEPGALNPTADPEMPLAQVKQG